ncbi:hypothetical protein [Streptomyces sp. NEAU-174]|uniref:hypothetical protein n=1 Tax=Streptomyces sp. NEAU-174 TaxID=3458254 RepID=UPI00404431AC
MLGLAYGQDLIAVPGHEGVFQGLKVETYRNGHARPDGTHAHSDAFVGHGAWADADPVLMVVEDAPVGVTLDTEPLQGWVR